MNFREVIDKNVKKTNLVIFSFLIIYFFVGLIVDIMFAVNFQKNNEIKPIIYILKDFLIFQNIPIITITMLTIGIVSILITFKFNDKMSLWGQKYKELNPNQDKLNTQEKQLYNIVEELKIASNMSYMPKVYLVDANYPNAFASGYSEKSSMVAITKGLLDKLNRQEIQAVMAHEISHIKHLDIKLTLFVGVLSNILLMIVDIFFRPEWFKNSKNNNFLFFIIALRITLPIITTFLLMFLSRTREYMADAGAVKLTRDPQALASALEKISNDYKNNKKNYLEKGGYIRNSAYIYPPIMNSISFINDLFSTHPSIESRIKFLLKR